jgi:hypothetical protein
MAKLYGWETLFHGTAVVCAPCGAGRLAPGVQSICRGNGSYFVDITNVTLYLFLFDRD